MVSINLQNIYLNQSQTLKNNQYKNSNDNKLNYSPIQDKFAKTSFKNNVIAFKGTANIQAYESLPYEERLKINSTFNNLFNDNNKESELVAIGKKPAAWFDTETKQDYDIFKKYKYLFESENIKIIINETGREWNGRILHDIFMFNTNKLKEVVDQNLDFYRDKFNNDKLSKDEVMDKLTNDKDSPLFGRKQNHDLIGVTLGYPLADSLLFKIETDISKTLDFLEQRKIGYPIHKKVLESTLKILRPDCYGKFDSKIDLPTPTFSINCDYYPFATWDQNHPEIKSINENNIKSGIKEAKTLFKAPNDFFQYILAKN